MRALIIVPTETVQTYEIDRIAEETRMRYGKLDIFHYNEFQIRISIDGQLLLHKHKLVDWSVYSWVIMFASGDSKATYINTKTGILEYFQDKRILNADSFRKYPLFTKLMQYQLLDRANIPIVDSYFDSTGKNRSAFKKPYVLKKILGSMGKSVHLVYDAKQANSLLLKYSADKVLFQKYIPGGEDLRIIVLGGRVLGGIRRRARKGGFLTNFSQGGSVEIEHVTPEVEELSIRVAESLGLEFVGMDLIFDHTQKHYLVLEVNRHAQFQGFEQATGVNVAGGIVDYMIRESESRQA